MTVIRTNGFQHHAPAEVRVWRCEGCLCVHIRAGEVLLTFTPAEFAAFTESVNDCYWRQEILGLAELDQPAGIPPATPDDDVIN